MRTLFLLIAIGIMLVACSENYAQEEIPLVYSVENTGAVYQLPPLPDFDDLPVVNPLTDPFEWSDGSSRDTTFASWSKRRSEIKAEIEHYEIGEKPTQFDSLWASYADTVLTVHIANNGNTLTLTSKIILPEGEGPFPAVIGIGSGNGSLPSSIFESRNIAQIPFQFWEVMAHTQNRGSEPINTLYPDLVHMGAYSAWSWGVSRLIDGLELVADSLPIDLSHLAVTGCSFAGKMALFAGAFDERIALTISQEPGGGGAAAWRVSETLGNVEKLGSTSHAWFMESMFRFSGKNVAKLPHDHHELIAMVAPRALLVLGNPDFEWLADESGYVSCRAAHEVWKNFGIGDRMGFSILGGHGHCQLPQKQFPEVEAFVDKFMLGDTTAHTNVEISIYDQVNYDRWIEWWGKEKSYFPEQFQGRTYTYEAECTSFGSDWQKGSDEEASNAAFLVSKDDKDITKASEIDEAATIHFPISVDSAGTYVIFARVNCESGKNSFWRKMNDGNYGIKSGLTTTGWEWKKFGEYELTEGDHDFYVSYRKNGGKLDKICLSSFMYFEPTDKEQDAENLCDPKVGINNTEYSTGFQLSECYPNPVNNTLNFSFNIPYDSHLNLKVMDIQGKEVATIADGFFNKGNHILNFNSYHLPKGVYLYKLAANQTTISKRFIKN